jgi:hypothetical protein
MIKEHLCVLLSKLVGDYEKKNVHYLGQSNSLFHPYVVKIIKSARGGRQRGHKIVVKKLKTGRCQHRR